MMEGKDSNILEQIFGLSLNAPVVDDSEDSNVLNKHIIIFKDIRETLSLELIKLDAKDLELINSYCKILSIEGTLEHMKIKVKYERETISTIENLHLNISSLLKEEMGHDKALYSIYADSLEKLYDRIKDNDYDFVPAHYIHLNVVERDGIISRIELTDANMMQAFNLDYNSHIEDKKVITTLTDNNIIDINTEISSATLGTVELSKALRVKLEIGSIINALNQ